MDETKLREFIRQARERRDLPDPEMRRYLRRRAGITQEKLASVLGVTRVTVARWENGTRNPSNYHLSDYLLALEVASDPEGTE